MATIRKRCWKTPSGVAKSAWIVSYSVGGKRHIKTFTLKKAAETWRAQTLTEIAHGTHAPVSTSITVAKAAELWLEQCRADGLERATQEQYAQHCRLHILPLLGHIRVAELTSASVAGFRTALAGGKRAKSRATIVKVMTSLSGILSNAQAAGLASRNVVRDQPRSVARRQRQRDKRHDIKLERGITVPTKDELRAILVAAEAMETEAVQNGERWHWRPLVVTLIFTGLRASELRGLRWADVDLAGATLAVRQRADRYQEIGKPKSAAGHRSIPLPPLVVTVLKEWWLACPKGPLDLVFPNKVGGVEVLHTITAALKACQVKAGLRGEGKKPRYGLHSFRHACISLWIDQGFSPKRVQTWAGHSSISITFGVYGHLFPDPEGDQAAMARVQAAVIGGGA
jgi:integrase